jgi:hypothetical protein
MDPAMLMFLLIEPKDLICHLWTAAACGIPTILTSGGSTDDYYDPSFVIKIEGTKKTFK